MKENENYFLRFLRYARERTSSVVYIRSIEFNDIFKQAVRHEKGTAVDVPANIRANDNWYKETALESMMRFYLRAEGIIFDRDAIGESELCWRHLHELLREYRRKPWVLWVLTLRMQHLEQERT